MISLQTKNIRNHFFGVSLLFYLVFRFSGTEGLSFSQSTTVFKNDTDISEITKGVKSSVF